MNPRLIAATFIVCLVLLTRAARGDNMIAWQPAKLEVDAQHSIDAQSGTTEVPERHERPQGKRIRLAVWRLPCSGGKPASEPIVYLHGGPGGNIADSVRIPGMAETLATLQERADVILVDQRGCGKSEPSLTSSIRLGAGPEILLSRQGILDCLEQASRDAVAEIHGRGIEDLGAYNTVESADDIDALRTALGADRIDLYAYSYGTHLALATIRRHPKVIAHAILCGVEGPDATYKLPSDIQAQLETIAALSHKDPAIAEHVPDLLAMLREGMAKLEKSPATVTVVDPVTRQRVPVKVGGFAYQVIVAKLYVGRTKDLAYLPRLAYSVSRGDGSQLTWGVQRLVAMPLPIMGFVCDAASGTSGPRLARLAAESNGCLLDNAANFPLPEINDDVFHVTVLGDDFREPLRSRVPTLFVSGSLDGNTPPHRADEVRAGFARGVGITIENAGHDDVATAPGLGELMVKFLRGADVSDAKLAVAPVKFQSIRTAAAGAP